MSTSFATSLAPPFWLTPEALRFLWSGYVVVCLSVASLLPLFHDFPAG